MIKPQELNQLQLLPSTPQQALFDVVTVTLWLYNTVALWEYQGEGLNYRTSQYITYWCYYYIHPLFGQVQVRISGALAHFEAFHITEGVG